MAVGTAQHTPESIGGSCLRPMLLHLGLDHIHLAFEFILIKVGYPLDSGNAYILWSRGSNSGGLHSMSWPPE